MLAIDINSVKIVFMGMMNKEIEMKVVLDSDDIKLIIEEYVERSMQCAPGKKWVANIGYVSPINVYSEDDPIEVPESTINFKEPNQEAGSSPIPKVSF